MLHFAGLKQRKSRMKRKFIASLFVFLCMAGIPIRIHAQAQRSPDDYIQELSQLLRDADAADISDMEADARRQRARQLAAQYAASVKASNPAGADRLYLAYLYQLANDTEKAVAMYREVLEDIRLKHPIR